MKYLFVGGPWDGQWHEVPKDRTAWQVPELPDAVFGEPGADIFPEVRLITYYRRTVADGPETMVKVYVAEGVVMTRELAQLTLARWRARWLR